ncbi:RidA family protein [Rhizobium sp. BE258]|uniref:RidA family protein n=1 Tax=Rhizobium sp. BE258 TaxID=2817722 RepID=UPI0028668614|nr:RidA family protein [Rhizobium sp. BE258]MDR7147736.1 reactive intermediate/imine deaminase [Rhizobium sp. BE258]
MTGIIPIKTEGAPAPLGHYSQAVMAAGLVHISGLLPVAKNGEIDPTIDFDEQARRVLSSLEAILQEAGAEITDVVKVNAYIVDVENWPTFNRQFAELFGTHRPARSVAPVPELHHGFKIEIDAIALDVGRVRQSQ